MADIYFLKFHRAEAGNQGPSKVGFWWELSWQPVDSCLLPVSSKWRRERSKKRRDKVRKKVRRRVPPIGLGAHFVGPRFTCPKDLGGQDLTQECGRSTIQCMATQTENKQLDYLFSNSIGKKKSNKFLAPYYASVAVFLASWVEQVTDLF